MLRTSTLILTTLLFICTALWMGSSGGPGAVQVADRTGGPVSDGFCSQCHGGGAFGADVQMLLTDESGDTISEYVPETAYTLKITVLGEGASSYGFQAVALGADNAGVGSYGTAPAGTQISGVAGRDYFEHNTPSAMGEWEVEWTAPSLGTGPVTFYAAGNAVNGNFGTSGDEPDTTSLAVEESLAAGLNDRILASLQLNISPNPVQERLFIEWSSQEVQPVAIRIFNAMGELVDQRSIEAYDQDMAVSVWDYPNGIYMVQIGAERGFQTKRFLKL
ncbi:MAG: T9SS type A sorting domain-containing protein [Saprospiraceae bacterium]|nr:T9SS type A sorting domain-containing protein [Saprospiraceae bacterium]